MRSSHAGGAGANALTLSGINSQYLAAGNRDWFTGYFASFTGIHLECVQQTKTEVCKLAQM